MADKTYIAQQATLLELKERVGTDSEEPESTVMGRLNNILELNGCKFYAGDHVIASHSGGSSDFTLTATPALSGAVTLQATLTGKNSTASSPAIQLYVDDELVMSLSSTSSAATDTKTADIAVEAGTPFTIRAVITGYSAKIENIRLKADVLTDMAKITIQ